MEKLPTNMFGINRIHLLNISSLARGDGGGSTDDDADSMKLYCEFYFVNII
jgi:hypothetical protein